MFTSLNPFTNNSFEIKGNGDTVSNVFDANLSQLCWFLVLYMSETELKVAEFHEEAVLCLFRLLYEHLDEKSSISLLKLIPLVI